MHEGISSEQEPLPGSVNRLQEGVIRQLRSAQLITTFSQALQQVIWNSIDAGGSCLRISLDLEKLTFSVADDGEGINPEELKDLLQTRYGTSRNEGIKCTGSLLRRGCHGFRGEALDSIIQSAFIVSMTTRSNRFSESYEKVWKEGRCVYFGPAGSSCLYSHGTTVTVHQLFHRWPVRSKFCLGNRSQELMKIKEVLQQFALTHYHVAISVRDQGNGKVFFTKRSTVSLASSFAELYGTEMLRKTKEVDFDLFGFRIKGLMSPPSPASCLQSSKQYQFLFVNGQPFYTEALFKFINGTYKMCKELHEIEAHDQLRGSKERRLSAGQGKHNLRKRPPSHPIFVLDVVCNPSRYDLLFESARSDFLFTNGIELEQCFVAMLTAFFRTFDLINGRRILQELEQSYSDLEDKKNGVFIKRSRQCAKKEIQTGSEFTGWFILPLNVGLDSCQAKGPSPNNACDIYELNIDEDTCPGEALCSASPFQATAVNSSTYSRCDTPSPEHPTPGLTRTDFSPRPLMESSPHLSDLPISTSLNSTPSSCDFPGLAQPEAAPVLEFPFKQEIYIEDCLTTAHGLTIFSGTSPKTSNIDTNASTSYCNPCRNGISLSCCPAGQISSVSPFFPEKTSCNHALSQRTGRDLCRPGQVTYVPPPPKETTANVFESAFFGLTSSESTPLSSEGKGEGGDGFPSSDHEAKRFLQACGVTVHRLSKKTPRFDQFHRSLSFGSNSGSEALESRSAPGERMELKRKQTSHWECTVKTPEFSPDDKAAAGDLEDELEWLNNRRSTERRFDELLLSQNSDISSFGVSEDNRGQGTDLSPFLDVEQILKGSPRSTLEPADSPRSSQVHLHGIEVEELKLPVAFREENEQALGINEDVVSAHVQRLGPACDCVVRNLELHDMNETCLEPEDSCPTRVPAKDKGPKDNVQLLKSLQSTLGNERHDDFRSLPKVELFDASRCTNFFAHIQLSRSMLSVAKVISQADAKFVLLRVNNLLLCMDQHAADERVRVERLQADLFLEGKGLQEEVLRSPILIKGLTSVDMDFCSLEEVRLFFKRWKFGIELRNDSITKDMALILHSVPRIADVTLKPGDFRAFLEEIKDQHISGLQRYRPQLVQHILNSKACRYAIMFGDILSRFQCETLLRDLLSCKHPFQCAHGRPSIVPLCDLTLMEEYHKEWMAAAGGDINHNTAGSQIRRSFPLYSENADRGNDIRKGLQKIKLSVASSN